MIDWLSGPRASQRLSILALATLTGCAGLEGSQKRIDTVRQTTLDLKEATTQRATSATVERTVRPRLSGDEVTVRSAVVLPAVLSKRVTFTTQGQSLAEALEAVGNMLGIPIRNSEDTVSNDAGPQPPQPPGQAPISGRVTIDFAGTGRGLLDELAARSNASWRYSAAKGAVEFYRFETRTLSIYMPPGAKQVSASISLAGVSGGGGGGGGGGGSTGGGNVSVSQNLNIDPWTSIMQGIQGILSDGGLSRTGAAQPGGATGGAGGGTSTSGSSGRATANPELGIITVTARPEAMERVASYVASINARFAQNVLVDVKVYSVSLDQQSSLGFSLDLLYSRLNRYGVSVVGGSPLAPATGTPGRITLSSNNPNSRWNGSEIVAQALSQFGTVALQTQGQVLAINGQPSPIQVANEVNYLASSATTQTPNVGSTTTLTPGTRVVGFTANFIPLILGNNQILLNYQMQISQLTALTQISSGNSSIQTPLISSQSLQQAAYMRDGEAIVLFGFDQSRDSSDTAASFSGASKAGRSERQMVVIVIQVNGGTRNVV